MGCEDALSEDFIRDAAARVIRQTQESFARFFSTAESLNAVPEVGEQNFASLHSGALVRLTAMVQHDSIGDQLFVPLAQCSTSEGSALQNCGLFCNEMPCLEEASFCPSNVIGRRMVVATPPPGLQGWASSEHPSAAQSVLLKFYGDREGGFGAEKLCVNSIISVMGIFEPSPIEGSRENNEVAVSIEYPHGLATIHVISLLQQQRPPSRNFAARGTLQSNEASGVADRLRGLWIEKLAMMGFTGTASKHLLFALMSRITSRSNGLLSSLLIGYHPVNVQLALGDFGNDLVELFKAIMPRVVVIPLTAEFLDASPEFASYMDYETGRLVPGLLQVANGTLIVIDERQLQEGKLSEKATRCLGVLIDLVSHQIVNYDFGGQSIPIPMDVPVVTISHGKSIIPIEVSFRADEPLREHSFEPDTIESLRSYVGHCSEISVEIPQQVVDAIEGHYVAKAKEVYKSDPNILARVLNISRLLTSSYGVSEMTAEHFFEAIPMI